MSQPQYPQYPRGNADVTPSSPHPGPYTQGPQAQSPHPQSPHPQSPHLQSPHPQSPHLQSNHSQKPYPGPPQYGNPPSNIALPNQVFSSPYYGAQPNGGPAGPKYNTGSPYSPHSPHSSHPPQPMRPPYSAQYNSPSHQHPQIQPTPAQLDMSRGGTMGPPSRPNDKPTDINDLGDVLAGSGVDLREEEAAMFRFNPDGGNQLREVAISTPTPYPFSRDNHYSPYVPGDRQSFYGAGTFNQPTVPYKSAEAIAEEQKKRAIRIKAEMKQYHLNDPFLLSGTLHKKVSAEVNKYHIKFDDTGLYLPKQAQPRQYRMHGPDGNEVLRTLQDEGILSLDSTFVEILSLLSLATEERMRMLVEDAATLARGRRFGALGVAPQESDGLMAGTTSLNAANALPTPGDSAISPSSNPLKRSYSEMNDLLTPTSSHGARTSNDVIIHLQRSMKQDRLDEDARLAKRAARKAKKAAAEGATDEGAATPGSFGDVAPNVDIKKAPKKGKAADNVSQAQQLNALNNTTQMALGGKKMPSWMSGGASKGPSNPYLARPNAIVKKDNVSNTNSPGSALPKTRVFGDFREDKEGGKGIQLRDMISVLEQNAKGTEKRALQKAYGLQSVSLEPSEGPATSAR